VADPEGLINVVELSHAGRFGRTGRVYPPAPVLVTPARHLQLTPLEGGDAEPMLSGDGDGGNGM
jgi:hypothetical protein